MSYRALVIGAGNAGKAHAEALVSIGIDVMGPLSGTAAVADPAPPRDPAVDVVHVTTANDLHPPLVETITGRHDEAVVSQFGVVRTPAAALRVALTY
ncbi:MAG: hypothetical protein AABM32_07155 [Chloroflexota bacterium]